MRSTVFMTMLAVLLCIGTVRAEVEWDILRQVSFPSAPLDVAVSADGQKVFVLLEGGEVQVLSATGKLLETLQFGSEGDRLAISPGGDRLFLSSRDDKSMQVAKLEFIKQIDISGSPFKGPADASVVIAAYSDFQ